MKKLNRDFEHYIIHTLGAHLSASVNGVYVDDDLEAKHLLWQAAQADAQNKEQTNEPRD